MPAVEFLRPRLRGSRFEGGEIPLDILSDLAGIGELAIEVAKWCFLNDNPRRSRSPKGFADSIVFKLTDLQKGSAVAVIGLDSTAPLLPGIPPPYQEYFDRSREAIVRAIAAAEQNESVAEYLPETCLGYFDRIGRSLRAGESIEFTTALCTTPARLTRESRRRLILASSRIRELTAEVRVRGSIPEVDQDRMTFELQLIEGRKIAGTMSDQHLDAIMEAFNGYRDSARVLIQGLGRYDRQDRLVRLQTVEHIALLDPLDVPARLDEFRGLKDGWLDGDGMAPRRGELDWLATNFDLYYPDDILLPHTYPTPKGGIEMEWSIGTQSVFLEIDLSARQADWLACDKESDEESTQKLDLNTGDSWTWLATEIRHLAALPT
jgi:hypothetical protein